MYGPRCPSPNSKFSIIEAGSGGNTFNTAGDRSLCTGEGCANDSFYNGTLGVIDIPGFKIDRYVIGKDQDYPYGHTSFTGINWYHSNSDGKNPSLPTQFLSTSKVLDHGIVTNHYAGSGQNENYLFWYCRNPAGCALPFKTSDFLRGGWMSTKWHGECSGTAPIAGSFNQGDWCDNTTPSELGTEGSKYVITRFECVKGGTPGTWVQLRALTGN